MENGSDQRRWSFRETEALVTLRHDPHCQDAFDASKGRARQISALWDSLAAKIDPLISGSAARNQYNYLVSQFKKHSAKAKVSGEGAVTWRYYNLLKEHLQNHPAISPVALLDSAATLAPLTIDTTGSEYVIEQNMRSREERQHKAATSKQQFQEQILSSMALRDSLLTKLVNRDQPSEEIKQLKADLEQLRAQMDQGFNNLKDCLNDLIKHLK